MKHEKEKRNKSSLARIFAVKWSRKKRVSGIHFLPENAGEMSISTSMQNKTRQHSRRRSYVCPRFQTVMADRWEIRNFNWKSPTNQPISIRNDPIWPTIWAPRFVSDRKLVGIGRNRFVSSEKIARNITNKRYKAAKSKEMSQSSKNQDLRNNGDWRNELIVSTNPFSESTADTGGYKHPSRLFSSRFFRQHLIDDSGSNWQLRGRGRGRGG